jgi:hypothetical protein
MNRIKTKLKLKIEYNIIGDELQTSKIIFVHNKLNLLINK